ncbi:Ethanolamine utilization protein [Bacillus freudenreichii]|nr:Ethanolamine utilization protein [Bacillus freudenreichii]
MHLNRQSALAESTLQELYYKNMSSPENVRPKIVLALLFYHMNGLDEGLKGLRELQERLGRHIRIRICPDQLILEHFNVTELACKTGIDDWVSLETAEKLKEKVDYFYIPVLPFSTVSDLLNFNDRQRPIRLLLWALMSGKKVCAYTAGADPFHSIWKEAGLDNGTPFLKHEMKKQLERLRGFGIQLFKNNAQLQTYFKPAALRKENQIITAETIKKHAETGKRLIEVGQGAIITPLARDVAKERQIEIYRKARGAQS